ncbi:MAG: F0F1 ATP synthase subunit delta [Candidatus Anaerobiospirillum merdipullorum]|uniref:ATP synthase subunit delta n=1 Tax=Candidatus Anaerobiospirillum merdipullorum TaxID=2838450 RepID=A0A9E2KNP7_9GAMM|nr:F0F1 ATP synthase subunit delta [Candidatus Anaerobiospirillum merdipullorum]
MAENLTIARPYAQAAFACAKENSCIDSWRIMLEAMADACRDENFLSYLKNAPSPESAAETFCKLLKNGEPSLLNEYGTSFISLIAQNGRFEAVPDIFLEFMRLKERDEKITEAVIRSARPLNKADLKEIKDKLTRKYGGTVNLKTVLDKSLIGGAVLQIGDEVIDGSVRSSLMRLAATLK